MEIKRGGVYYIDNPTFTGHEMAKDRPAVVVSCDAMNCTSSVVSVVYMTGSKPADTPYRVRISAARSVRHGDSTACAIYRAGQTDCPGHRRDGAGHLQGAL